MKEFCGRDSNILSQLLIFCNSVNIFEEGNVLRKKQVAVTAKLK
ncbi:hypothetical protein QY95_04050 [Bacillus thermotolerans]|uniref:Uncharacterized protein n=1 Tax=Bacillus thermotolerans TaxID=1221996 RepID=A0A0F5HLA1_BACTR|nr:hypothetical protein QY95_04050 [Bacillus thermotolerans]